MRLEKPALGVSLKRGEKIALTVTQHRSEVSEQLRQRLTRSAEWRFRLAAQPAPKPALRAL